uniref:protein S-acyltransferase n=1 Tax=Cyprinus carpio TaxID=7962 RepID=A0A8C1J5R9_CYPCA
MPVGLSVDGALGYPSPSRPFRPSRYVPVSAATALLVGTTTLFLCFTCPWLSERFSSSIPLYNVVIFLFTLANFCMATFMDPGIFPRAEEDEDKEDDFRAPLYKTVEVRGIQVRMKWCSTCRFYRPPRCSHCSVCDNCCRWSVNRCNVGLRAAHAQNTCDVSDGDGSQVHKSYFLTNKDVTFLYRYLGRLRKPHSVQVQPPFLRPPLSEAQLEAKVLDNGIQQSKSSLEIMESQSTDADPPPPPKPEHRYPGLPHTQNEECSLLTEAPATPSLYKYRPAYSSPGKNHTASTHSSKPSYRSDPSLSSRGGAGCRGGGEGGRAGSGGLGGASAFGGRSYPSFTDTLLQSAAASCSSSLRSAHTAHNALGPLISEGTTSTSYKSLANQTRNGSLSYESLLTPSESPEFESAAHELTAPGAPPILGYTSPFLSAQQREGSLQACPAPLRPSPNRAFLRPTSSPPSRAPPLSPRARSLGSPPPGPAPGHTPLGKSLSYGGGVELQHRPSRSGGGTSMPNSTIKQNVANHNTHSHKPAGGVKKVTGVGGTTYGISV